MLHDCRNCPYVQLSPQHIVSRRAIQARIFKNNPKVPEDLIYSDKAVEKLPKPSSIASERSKAPPFLFYSIQHIMDMLATTRETVFF
ncbi:hypothetical protein TNCV_1535701 [Trichonephila clavipes]|uniref:Uncharacterized protein n=1 Tax=Trichonephila clavipes TaxID=2585209 RepID=A0A8X6UW17_TRICX|nr:hypothetical protein TNCV_1535701 [Trichonephila clavipes]